MELNQASNSDLKIFISVPSKQKLREKHQPSPLSPQKCSRLKMLKSLTYDFPLLPVSEPVDFVLLILL